MFYDKILVFTTNSKSQNNCINTVYTNPTKHKQNQHKINYFNGDLVLAIAQPSKINVP
jgi:hypothetical protein